MNIKQLLLVTIFVCATDLSAGIETIYNSAEIAKLREQLKTKNVPYEGKTYTVTKQSCNVGKENIEYELESPVTILNILDIGKDGIVVTDEPTKNPPFMTIETTPRVYNKRAHIIGGISAVIIISWVANLR